MRTDVVENIPAHAAERHRRRLALWFLLRRHAIRRRGVAGALERGDMTPKRDHDSSFKRQIIGSSEDVISYRTSRCCIGVISQPRAPMDPPAKKMKTSPPTLCDMPDEMLAHIASHLEPGDVFNMVLSSKKLFRPAGVVDLTADEDANREEALGLKLVKWSMRHRLKKILTPFGKKKFTFDGLFPEEERNLDFVSGNLRWFLSAFTNLLPNFASSTHKEYGFADAHRRLVAVKCAVPRRSGKGPGDIDIFCSGRRAHGRRRLFHAAV